MRILGIESSCDETAAAVVEGSRRVLSNVISSQIDVHRAHGGVVPELAARGQITAILPVIDQALADANVTFDQIDAIAFTQGPGLAGSLLVGVNAAKALGWSLGKPTIPVNHLEGHVHANWLYSADGADPGEPGLPALCLLVSGGHTELLLVRSATEWTTLGTTLDDAAGEAFDKGARLLGLGYPGGPAIQRAGNGGNRNAFAFPRAQLESPFNFSFSGVKTSLLRQVQPWRLPDPPRDTSLQIFPEHRPPRFRDGFPVADLAASYEEAICDALVSRTLDAAIKLDAATVLLAGGVAANGRLRALLKERGAGLDIRWPRIDYCTDNAAMIAGRAHVLYQSGMRGSLSDDAYARFPTGATT